VARLTPSEFRELIDELVKVDGVGKLQEKLLRSRALVSRRRLGSVDQLSRQLYQLTLGLDRDGIVSQVVVALWEERLRQGLDEEASKRLEEIGEKVNACLAGGRELDPAKEGDLRSALTEYRNALAEHVGDVAARLTMLVRAFPAVARLLRDEAGSA
jgi:DNA-directed RNA polymerase subunit F